MRLGFFILIFLVNLSKPFAQILEKPRVNGYVKYLPMLRYSPATDDIYFDHLVHNRFNVNWKISNKVQFHGALRTRIFEGFNVKNIPNYERFIDVDNNWLSLSAVIFKQDSWLMHTTSDRFFFDFTHKKWKIRAGRQRINWGINMISNPNDLFNTYSFFDFDYEERPGSDALRIQYFIDALKRVELAYSTGVNARESVAAILYGFNYKRYDVQFITGYFHNRWSAGGGWAGNIKKVGFKGELSYFYDLEKNPTLPKGNLVTSVALDYVFNNSSFLMVEYLYNEQRETLEFNPLIALRPLRADNLMFAEHSVFSNYSYPINPILNAGIAIFYYPVEQGVFISPNIRYNVQQNIDLMLISQIFTGSSNSIFANSGYLLATALKWNF